MEILHTLDLKLWEELKTIVPEVKDNPQELVQYIYDRVAVVYGSEEDKYLRFYYVGYILTSDEDASSVAELSISNVSIKGTDTDYRNTNPYYIKLKRLLDIKNLAKNTLNRKTRIVVF